MRALTVSPQVERAAPPPHRFAPAWQIWTGLAIIYVVWGSTYLAIRVMVETMPPLLSAGVRFAVAGAIFWLAIRLSRARHAFGSPARRSRAPL